MIRSGLRIVNLFIFFRKPLCWQPLIAGASQIGLFGTAKEVKPSAHVPRRTAKKMPGRAGTRTHKISDGVVVEDSAVQAVPSPPGEEPAVEDFQEDEAVSGSSTSLLKAVSEEPKMILDKEDVRNKCIFKTKYGYLKLINSCLTFRQQEKIKKIYYLHNTIPTNYIRKILKADKNSLLVFTPDCTLINARQLCESYKKILNAQYYGTPKKVRNPFKNCKSNQEIFNLARRIQTEQKSMLHRICVISNYDGNLRLKGKQPQVGLLKKFTQITHPVKEIEGHKYDFLLPYQAFTGIYSAENYEKLGIKINALNQRKIFNLYGVFPPTRSHLYDLFAQYIKSKQNLLKADRAIIDLGCGSGVLGFIFADNSNTVKVYALDKDEDAVHCARLNSQVLGFGDRYNAKHLDLVLHDENEIRKKFEDWE